MTIPKDLANKRDELTQNYYDKYVCGDKPSFVDGFNAGIQAALSSEHVLALVKALKEVEEYSDFAGAYFPQETAKKALAKWSKRNE